MRVSWKITSPVVGNVLLVILGSILALAVTELILRLIPKNEKPLVDCRQENRELHHSLKPNTLCHFSSSEWNISYRINSIGLRDEEIAASKDDEFRILVLGDSFVEGYGVDSENRLTEILEKNLASKTNRKINVINAGVASYSPLLEYLSLMKLEYLSPDLVLVGVDLTDFNDEIGYYNYFRKPDEKAKTLEEEASRKAYEETRTNINTEQAEIQQYKRESGWGKKNLTLYLRIKMTLRQLKTYVIVTNFVKDILNRPYLAEGSPLFIEGDIESDLFAVTREGLGDEVYHALFNLPKKSLSDITLYAKEKEIKLMFFTYPHGMQVDGEQWAKGRLTRGFVRGETYSSKPLEDIVKIGDGLKVPSANLLKAFQENSAMKLFFDKDGHFTPGGHKVAADELTRFIIANQLIEF